MRLPAPPSLTPAQRRLATLAGVALLVIGAAWSVRRLGLGWADLRATPLFLNLVLVQPAILALAAVSLRLSGRAVGADLGLSAAARAVGYANYAEILPLPGGAMVRGAALMRAGADLKRAAAIVTVTAILSLALVTAIAASALVLLGTAGALPVLLAALAGLLVCLWLIRRRAGTGIALGILGVRLATAGASAFSVHLALQALGIEARLLEALVITTSATFGSAVAIVPAGLGISEGLAAALATLTTIAPAAAFLALALHRVLALIASLGAAVWPAPRSR